MNAPASKAAFVRETRRERRARIKRMADADWSAIGSEVDPATHARRTVKAMTPERRAELERGWL